MSLQNTMKSFEKYNRKQVRTTLDSVNAVLTKPEINFNPDFNKLNSILNQLKENSEFEAEVEVVDITTPRLCVKSIDDMKHNLKSIEEKRYRPITPPKPKRVGRPPKILKDVKIAKK